MKKPRRWGYEVLDDDFIIGKGQTFDGVVRDKLNSLGDDGWELVSADVKEITIESAGLYDYNGARIKAIFKREQ